MKKTQEENDMGERDFVKEIDGIKTAVLGYDREEVVLYIRELVNYYEKKNEESVKSLYLEKMRLVAENAGLQSEISTQKEIYAELAARMDRINQSVEMRVEAERIQNSELEQYRSREYALNDMAGKAKEQAEETLRHAEASAKALVNNANIERERILSEAGLERRRILKEADEKQKEILAEAGRQMDVILVKTREKVEKEQELYYQYRSRLEILKDGLDAMFAECPPVTEEEAEKPLIERSSAEKKAAETQKMASAGKTSSGEQEETFRPLEPSSLEVKETEESDLQEQS